MEKRTKSDIDDLIKWVISVDRRFVLIESMKGHTVGFRTSARGWKITASD